jgi:hypothetical protein
MSEIVATDGSELRELTIDELDEVSGCLPVLTLAVGLLISHLLRAP